MKFRAAAVQIAPRKADYSGNLARIGLAIQKCSEEGADLVIFPETALTGYFLEGGVADVAVTAEQLTSDFAAAMPGTRTVDVIVGFYESLNGNIYNSAAHIEFSPKPQLRHVHRKFFIPTYGVFDEERFVGRGRSISAYETRFGKLGLLICEDVWHSICPTILALKGAVMVNVIAASPARGFSSGQIGNLKTYENLLSAFTREHGVWSVASMLVGFEGGKGFTGGSMIANPFGEILARGPICEEHILTGEIDLELVSIARQAAPLISDLTSTLEDLTREITEVSDQECQ